MRSTRGSPSRSCTRRLDWTPIKNALRLYNLQFFRVGLSNKSKELFERQAWVCPKLPSVILALHGTRIWWNSPPETQDVIDAIMATAAKN